MIGLVEVEKQKNSFLNEFFCFTLVEISGIEPLTS